MTKAGRFPSVRSLKPIGSNCGTLIRLEDRVLFDFDSADLRADAGPVLDAVAKVAKPATGTIKVNEHTDSIGSDGYNDDLSLRRARAVAKALTDRGIGGGQLAVKAFGETQPVAPNTVEGKDNPAGRQLNRRVDVVIPST